MWSLFLIKHLYLRDTWQHIYLRTFTKMMCITLRLGHVLKSLETILSSIVNTIGRAYVCHLKTKRFPTWGQLSGEWQSPTLGAHTHAQGSGWAWVRCYCSWVGMGVVHPYIKLQIKVKLLRCREYANQEALQAEANDNE